MLPEYELVLRRLFELQAMRKVSLPRSMTEQQKIAWALANGRAFFDDREWAIVQSTGSHGFDNSLPGDSRVRVGFLACAYQRIGGTETFHRTLLPRLKRVRPVGFVTTAFPGGDPNRLGDVTYGEGLSAAGALARSVDVLVSWGVDVLESILPNPRPKVITVHHGDMASWWSNDFTSRTAHISDCIVAVNPHVAQAFGGVYIPNGIDPLRLTYDDEASGLLAAWSIPRGERIALWMHRLAVDKQPLFALEIAKHLPTGWVMVLAGDGPIKAEVIEKARAIPNVRVVGAVDRPGNWFAHAERFISTAENEGFGLSVAEAVSYGLPTVATPYGIAENPIVCQMELTRSPAEWAEAIVSAKALHHAQELVRERYSADEMASRWESVIARVASGERMRHAGTALQS